MSKAIRIAKPEFPETALVDVARRAGYSHPGPHEAAVASQALRRDAPIRLSALPGPLDDALLPAETSSTRPNELPDIVLLAEANATALLIRRFGRGAAAILPVVDATCRGRGTRDHRRADITVDRASQRTIDEAVEMLRPAAQRLRSLPREVIETEDMRLMLLARLFVRDRAFAPRSDVNARETFVYDDEAAIPGAAALAEQLAAQGLLERKFADKTTICPHCASARMTVREHCSRCGDANIVEEPIVHHFKCACQGPERDFRRGDELICPKCLQQLKNFSVDYDRPGSIGVCLGCGHLSTEHKVGFVCLDCDARVDARSVASRTVYSYHLTDAGRTSVIDGVPLPRAEDDAIAAKILEFARIHSALGQPCSVLFIRLQKPEGIAENGDAWGQTCAFFSQIIRECFTRETEIIEAAPVFLALLGRDGKEAVKPHLPKIRARLERHLALAPAFDIAVFSPDEVPRIAGRSGKVS